MGKDCSTLSVTWSCSVNEKNAMNMNSMAPPGTACSQLSVAERLRALPRELRRKWLAGLSDGEAQAVLRDWKFWARPEQPTPTAGDWVNWLILAGRGWGKTRTGAEQVRAWAKDFPIVNLVGPTSADVRDIMVQGQGAGASIMEKLALERKLVWTSGKTGQAGQLGRRYQWD